MSENGDPIDPRDAYALQRGKDFLDATEPRRNVLKAGIVGLGALAAPVLMGRRRTDVLSRVAPATEPSAGGSQQSGVQSEHSPEQNIPEPPNPLTPEPSASVQPSESVSDTQPGPPERDMPEAPEPSAGAPQSAGVTSEASSGPFPSDVSVPPHSPDPSASTPESNGLPQSAEATESRVPTPDTSDTLEELLKDSSTITIGTGAGDNVISRSIWEEAKQNDEWWKEQYWYRPENMGAFTLVNYDALKASYEARLSEIPEEMRYPNGYPSQAEILRWTTEGKLELMKLGMSDPTKEQVAQLDNMMQDETVRQRFHALDNLWHASWWVREGDTIIRPKLEDSQKILEEFRKKN